MTFASALYHFSHFAPTRYLVPKGLRNRIFMNLIRSLTDAAVRTSGVQDIYSTRPLSCDPESLLKVWMLTSQKDLLMAFWCLKSLIWNSGEVWDVWLADGGNLQRQPTVLLRQHFPGIRILPAGKLYETTSVALRRFPLSNWLRHEWDCVFSMKLFDPLLQLSPHRFLLLDSDILFFQRPVDLLACLRNERHLAGHAFNMENGNINAGLAVIDPSIITLEEIERHLTAMTKKQRRGYFTEQNLYRLLARDRFHGLGPEYAVQPLTDEQLETCTACHYTGGFRHMFFSQGIPRLRAMGFLNSLNEGGVALG
jgi:hypothetical protein